ncbi:DHH family phosphoesterase [Candidatus Solincola sp.]|nr:DHH family phosphoesterase [Actinomycetota bacterium]MDI7252105.1 DHH family phosphoesterase [Actinomycetota bacterium]
MVYGLEGLEGVMSKDELRAAVRAVEESGVVCLSSHVNPDGDGLGSLLGLTLVLRALSKEVYSALPRPEQFPPQYLFLPGRDSLCSPEELPESADLFIALDCSNPERLEGLRSRAEAAGLLVNVDHHEDNSLFGDIDLVDPKASSTSELVYRLMRSGDWELTPEVATCLYTGLVTDTGRFQHRNTGPGALAVASELAAAGANLALISREVYESQSLSYTRLVGRALERAEVLEDLGLVYSYITQRDLKETGASLPETEDLIDHLRAVRGTRVAALFKELEDGKVRVSLRSRDGAEVGPVARALGGGGHASAAGYTSDLDLEGSLARLVEVLRRARHG